MAMLCSMSNLRKNYLTVSAELCFICNRRRDGLIIRADDAKPSCPTGASRVARAQLAREGACLILQVGGKGLLSGLSLLTRGG